MIQIVPDTNIIYIKYQPTIPGDVVQLINDCIQTLIEKHQGFIIHLDLKGLNITTLIQNREWIDSVFHRMETTNYNSYLVSVNIYNAPFISRQLYTMMSRYLKDLKKKVTFVPKEPKEPKRDSISRFQSSYAAVPQEVATKDV